MTPLIRTNQNACLHNGDMCCLERIAAVSVSRVVISVKRCLRGRGLRQLKPRGKRSSFFSNRMKKTRYFSLEEVKQHSSKGDCWVVINRGVYDLSRWIRYHPGGDLPILYMAGRDCTDVFRAFHLPSVMEKKLPAFKIGEIEGGGRKEAKKQTYLQQDFEQIREEIEADLDTNYWFYAKHAVSLSILFAVVVYCVVFSKNAYIQVGSAVVMAMFWQQMAFVGHDTGHHAITHDPKKDDLIGVFVGNLTTGISIGWWKKSHNAHHIVTNSVEFDPDIQHLPVLAITDKFFKSVKSMYHDRILHFNTLSKFFVCYQHWLYYLIMGLARYNLYAQSFLLVYSLPRGLMKNLELLSLLLFWAWYFYLCSFLPSWTSTFLFVSIAHFFAGLLHIQITLSHFSMETYNGLPLDAFQSSEFLLSQLATTMDVECYPWLDFFHGGLQFQIEHHLFPRLPRHKLRDAKTKIQELCKKHSVTYRSKTFLEANIEVLQNLKRTAEKAQCISPIIWEGIHAIG